MDLPIPVTTKATLTSLDADKTEVRAHFNPATLVYTVENPAKEQAGTPSRKQFAAHFTGKLSMDLQFDTTGTGEDVRSFTHKLAAFMQPSKTASKDKNGQNIQAQPLVSFQWAAYEFIGTMESYKETIDFFSADGVPLRALVSISLARQDKTLDKDPNLPPTNNTGSLVPTSGGNSVTQLATLGGDPSAARQLGADNGLESLRFTSGVPLQVNSGIQLNAAAGFAGAVSSGGGALFGSSAGVSGRALIGGQASAGAAAAAGAFAGLEAGRTTVSSTARLDPLRMVPATISSDVSTGLNASFGLGGEAAAGSGFTTDVGTQFSFNDRLSFD